MHTILLILLDMYIMHILGRLEYKYGMPTQQVGLCLTSICREITLLRSKARARSGLHSRSITKASMLQCARARPCLAPSNVRQVLWKDIEEACVTNKSIGKGVFANCFVSHMGGIKAVRVKLLTAGDKYKSLFYSESKILSELCHYNLPWIHGLCCNPDHIAIVMTPHPYNGENASMNIYDALHKNFDKIKTDLKRHNWTQVVLGCSSALVYLKSKSILHSDIKSDYILIEKLPPQFTDVRAVLIDFNKACLCCEARLQRREYTMLNIFYKIIAPEVRNGRGHFQVMFILLGVSSRR